MILVNCIVVILRKEMVRLDVEWEKHKRESKKKHNEIFVKGVGLVEEEDVMSVKQIDNELIKIKNMNKEEQKKSLEKLSERSRKRIKRLKEQMENLNQEQSPKQILIEQSGEQEIENYIKGINWVDDEYLNNSWKRLKAKTIAQLKQSDFLFTLFSYTDKIIGKPQIRDYEQKTNIRLLAKVQKNNKNGEPKISYKFVDDPYNRRDDGFEIDVLEEDFWVYDVVDNGIKYIVLSLEKLDNHEVHSFYGTSVKINHPKEFDKNLSCRGSALFFFCKKAKSTIKPLKKEKLINYVNEFIKKDNIKLEEYKALMKDYIFIHENGYVYNQPDNYGRLRHSILLSGKFEGYPLHSFIWGGFGIGKTQEIECLDNIFQETILEAANSTPKSLIPSFSEKIPNPGFILNCNRVALIDELMKMVDNALNNTRGSNDVKNQFGNLNFILEHRKRRANSGNGQLFCMPTSKVLAVMNPSSKSNYIHQELDIIEASTISRVMPYVKGENYVKFIENNVLKKCAKTHPLYCKKNVENGKNIPHNLPLFAQRIRAFYLTIYDSCQAFNSKVNQGRVKIIHDSLVNLAKNPMKTLWKRRGYHHTFLVLDGIVKYRCLFEDLDDSFEAKDIDYDNLEKILIEMVLNWNFNMTIEKEDVWKTI